MISLTILLLALQTFRQKRLQLVDPIAQKLYWILRNNLQGQILLEEILEWEWEFLIKFQKITRGVVQVAKGIVVVYAIFKKELGYDGEGYVFKTAYQIIICLDLNPVHPSLRTIFEWVDYTSMASRLHFNK